MSGSAPPLHGIARDLLFLRTPALWLDVLEWDRRTISRDLLFLRTPALWPTWPLLAVMRRRPGQEEEYGVLYDFAGTSGRTGFGATVFLSNLFLMPVNEDQILALPREVFDNAEEIVAAHWRVD